MLKPCPFCGEAPVLQTMRTEELPANLLLYMVTCTGCMVSTFGCRSKEQAIAIWSRRAES